MSDKHFVNLDITGFANNGQSKPISRVTLIVDDKNSFTAGNDTGMELQATCPYATQAMVNAILAEVVDYQYQAFDAGAAGLDPAAELGDGVTVGGVYSTLSRINDDGRGYPDISAPGELELEEEYPSEGYITKEFSRKIDETRSLISKTADEILLQVSNEIQQMSASIETRIDGINMEVSSQNGSTVFTLKDNEATLSTQTLNLTVEAANVNGLLTAAQIKLGGYMDIYDSLQSNTVSGRFGKTTVTVEGSPYEAVGITSLSNGYIAADGILIQVATRSISMFSDTGIIMNVSNDNSAVAINAPAILFNGSIIHYRSSDRRLKADIDYQNAEKLALLCDQLNPVTFRMTDYRPEDRHVGFIAQEVREAADNVGLPGILTSENNRGFYTLDYGEITAVLTAKIQQLDKRMKYLERGI